jgi:hypothetical protein
VPIAAKIDAYSIPMTLAPTTTSDAGIFSRQRIPSESMTRFPSKETLGGRAGFVPVAMTRCAAVIFAWPPFPSTESV